MQTRNEKGQTLSEFLAAYDENKYRRPSVTVDMAVFTLVKAPTGGHEIAVLLIRRKEHPFIGEWALPGGFLNMEEELSIAAARELLEETGVKDIPLRQFGTFGGVNRDPRTRVITVGHYAIAPYGYLTVSAGDDAADAALFRVSLCAQAATQKAAIYGLRLSGPCELHERVKLGFDALGLQAVPVEGGDLASDHGLMLFEALRALADIPLQQAAKLFAGTRPLVGPARLALRQLHMQFHCPG